MADQEFPMTTEIHAELRVAIPSRRESGFVHEVGTGVRIVEPLGTSAFLVELRIPAENLVGDAQFETVEVYERELKLKL